MNAGTTSRLQELEERFSELEKELNTSKSTIVRLAKMLGYEGFHDLQAIGFEFRQKMRGYFGTDDPRPARDYGQHTQD